MSDDSSSIDSNLSSDFSSDSNSDLDSDSDTNSGTDKGVLIMGNKIGSGNYGTIVNSFFYENDNVITDYKGKRLYPGVEYAIKILSSAEALQEIGILVKLGDSPYVMKYFGWAHVPNEKDKRAMVLEKLAFTLFDRISKSNIYLRRTNYSNLVLEMFKALRFLDSKNIAHLDLHSNNVMFQKNYPFSRPKVIDFGWAQDTQGYSFMPPFYLDSSEPWRCWHPPEQRVFRKGSVSNAYMYELCTTKFDMYTMAVNLIHLIYDSSKNENMDTAEFHVLMTQTILRLNTADFRFSVLDEIDTKRRVQGQPGLYPTETQIVDDVFIVSTGMDAIHTCFKRGSDGFPKLFLCMPDYLGRVLKGCLMFEKQRLSASDAVNSLQFAEGSSSASASGTVARLRF